MASKTPATMLGVKKGNIEVGYDAEFIVLMIALTLLCVLYEEKW